jgi:hypothetical protein
MEQESNSMRDKLLARLPQTENLAAYREETASLLERHEKALFWEKWPGIVVGWLAMFVWIAANSTWGPKVDINEKIYLESLAGFLLFVCLNISLSYRIMQSKVYLWKEVKQLQLQVLELQASLRKAGNE